MKKALLLLTLCISMLAAKAQSDTSHRDTTAMTTDEMVKNTQYYRHPAGADSSLLVKTAHDKATSYIDWLVSIYLLNPTGVKSDTPGICFLSRGIPNLIITDTEIIRIKYSKDIKEKILKDG